MCDIGIIDKEIYLHGNIFFVATLLVFAEYEVFLTER